MSPGYGNPHAQVFIIGEAYTYDDERALRPFSGTAGYELTRMLSDAKIMSSNCYFTNVVNKLPPHGDPSEWVAQKKKDITPRHIQLNGQWVDPIVAEGIKQLQKELELVQPKVIITLGNFPLWALTGARGAEKWRGSLLDYKGTRLVPTLSPLRIIRQWADRADVVRDLMRAQAELVQPVPRPTWNFRIRPNFSQVIQTLEELSRGPVSLDLDIETRANHIACIGLSWSRTDALVIPLMCVDRREGYWDEHEEGAIIFRLYKLLTSPLAFVRWQNGLFDAQYLMRYWHFAPKNGQDTMISQHVLFAGRRKSLAYQASLYCEHYLYWKDDGRQWAPDVGEDQLWAYNAQDCVRTREVGEVEAKTIEHLGLTEPEQFQQAMFEPLLQTMVRGVRVDTAERNRLTNEVLAAIEERENFFLRAFGHPLNVGSSKQMTTLFYEDLKQPPIKTRAKKGIPGHLTCDDEALVKISAREPLLRPIIQKIQEIRSLRVFLSTFLRMPLDPFDGRMRCSYNATGTETFRLSSSENVFGSGGNLQNLPKGSESGLLPNIRKLFVPDPGYTFFDTDLDRADLQVVAWEADQPELKYALRKGVDMHLMNAFAISGNTPPDLDWLVEGHPEYDRIRGGMKKERQLAKMWCHGTNYGGSARTMAANCGITVLESERAQKTYFGQYPGIHRWHKRVEEQLHRTKTVTNKFGYRRFYFERIDTLLPEALAWIPQSTVGLYINRVWLRIYQNLPSVQVLLQVHDSLAGQFPTARASECAAAILAEAKHIIIPYDDPLIIPLGIKTSPISWGHCV